MCPRLGVPFASLEAYKMIKRVEAGEFGWSSLLGTFVGKRDEKVQCLPKDWVKEFGIVKREKEKKEEKAVEAKKPPAQAGPNPNAGFRPISIVGLRPAPPHLPPGLWYPPSEIAARPGLFVNGNGMLVMLRPVYPPGWRPPVGADVFARPPGARPSMPRPPGAGLSNVGRPPSEVRPPNASNANSH
jgi:hypothetical protein